MMKVVHIPSWFPTASHPPSGIFIRNMIEVISEAGDDIHMIMNWHETRFASLRNPVDFIHQCTLAMQPEQRDVTGSMEVYRFHYLDSHAPLFGHGMERLERAILKIIEKGNHSGEVKLIHAHVTYPGGYLAYRISQKTGIPYVISEQMSPFPFDVYKPNIQDWIIDPVRHAAKVTALSSHQAGEIRQVTGVQAEVIPNVVKESDFPFCDPSGRSAEFTFLTIGMLSSQKGYDILLEACALLKDMTSRLFSVRIAGDGAILGELQKQAEDLGITDRIVWLGMIDRAQVLKELMRCWCFVSSSRHESFGVVIAEAMATGRPVIATDSGGPRDFVGPEDGYLVRNEDPVALAGAMKKMLEQPGTFDPSVIRKNYLSKCSSAVVRTRYRKLYDEVLGENGKAGGN